MRLVKWACWLIVMVLVTGISLAIYQPENVMAAPFRGLAVKTLQAGSSMMSVIRDARTVAATQEYTVMLQALQCMQISENVPSLPAVSKPTSDMTQFPSTAHPLFPTYIATRNSEFGYSITGQGELILDKDEGTVDPALAGLLEKIQLLEQGTNPAVIP